MAGAIHVIRWILVLGRPMQLLRMVEGHDLVPLPMDDVDGALDVGHAVYIREVVDWECPSEIEHDTEG